MAKSSIPYAPDASALVAAAGVDVSGLLRLLHIGDVDAAIEAGLMRLPPAALAAADDAQHAVLMRVRQRLLTAWAARGRFRVRQARLQRRECERQARCAAESVAAAADADRAGMPAAHLALPAAAVAALARARVRASPQAM